jgi:hypothetical protein
MAAYLWTLAGPRWAFGAGSVAALLGAWAIRQARRHDPELAAAHRLDIKSDRSLET